MMEPSKEAVEWVENLVDWCVSGPSCETREEADREYALRIDAFAAEAVRRRESEIALALGNLPSYQVRLADGLITTVRLVNALDAVLSEEAE